MELALEDDPDYEDPTNMFLTKSGYPFDDLSKWYKSVHVGYMAPYPVITLRQYRDVFVSDRMDNPDIPGPSNEGAAIIMGNSVPTWEASYWKNKRVKQATKAGQDMGKYRDHHLREEGYYAGRMGDDLL